MSKRILLVFAAALLCFGCHQDIEDKVIELTHTQGVLCAPENAQAAVLLIGGSGAVDLDYTIHDVPVYQQLALKLKESNIASLRLKKRSASQFDSIQEEWLDDMAESLNYLQKRYRCVFLLGHSLSAMLLPVFDEQADGLIMLAGAASEIEQIAAAQMMSMFDEAEQIQNELQIILSLKEDSGFSWFGFPESWWISWDQLNLSQRFSCLKSPILVLHGSEDQKIQIDEFYQIQQLLKDHSDAEFQQFEGLDHFFMHQNSSCLDESVMEKIASWILEKSSVIIKKKEQYE